MKTEKKTPKTTKTKKVEIYGYLIADYCGLERITKIPTEFFMADYPLASALCVNTLATEPGSRGECFDADHDNGIITAEFGFGEDRSDKYKLIFGPDETNVEILARHLSGQDESNDDEDDFDG
jgi:hypothetical protein